MRAGSLLAFALLTGCTARPPTHVAAAKAVARFAAPTRALSLIGQWSAVAINGAGLKAGDQILLTVTSTTVQTSGLCNNLFGHYQILSGRLVPDGPPWPRSERGCSDATGKRDPMALEDRVYAVFWYSPSIRMPDMERLHLESARGSIDFDRR